MTDGQGSRRARAVPSAGYPDVAGPPPDARYPAPTAADWLATGPGPAEGVVPAPAPGDWTDWPGVASAPAGGHPGPGSGLPEPGGPPPSVADRLATAADWLAPAGPPPASGYPAGADWLASAEPLPPGSYPGPPDPQPGAADWLATAEPLPDGRYPGPADAARLAEADTLPAAYPPGADPYEAALAPGSGRRRRTAEVPAPRTEPDRRAARRRRSGRADVPPQAAPAEPSPGAAPPARPGPGRRAAARRGKASGAGTGTRRAPENPGAGAPGAPRGRRADRTAGPDGTRGRRAGAGAEATAPGGAPPAGARSRRAAGPKGPGTWRRLVPQALVVAFLAGGTSAFVASDKAVRLTVDGVPRTMHTFADDVTELLGQQGVGVGEHDLVAPAPGSPLADGDEVVVRYGRPVVLTLDGTRRRVWTTAGTVEAALRQLGVRAEGAYLSASRSTPITRRGMSLSVRTERSVTFLADGRERTVRTNAATVREALDQAGISLQGQDTTSVPPGSFPRDGQTVTVLRITGTREVREELIPYRTEKVTDDELFAGTEVVERTGKQGARRVTYALRTVNGVRQRPRRIAEEVVREPVTQRIRVGTRPLPTSVAGADGLDWGSLAHCESGGRPGAVDGSGTYGGLYQFDVQTWQSLGGSGRPQDASGSEQTYRAKKLYVQRGASPWPHCGRRLYR